MQRRPPHVRDFTSARALNLCSVDVFGTSFCARPSGACGLQPFIDVLTNVEGCGVRPCISLLWCGCVSLSLNWLQVHSHTHGICSNCLHMESAATVFSSRMKRRVRNAAIVEVVAPLLQELYFGTCSSPLERGTDGTNENCFGFARRVLHQALGLDVEADNQADRSKCAATHRRMPAWSRVCILRTWCALLYLMRAR